MEIAKIQVNGVKANKLYCKDIPHGIIGAQVAFEFDSAWQSLRKTVVFRGCCTKDVLDAGDIVTIPAEVVANPGVRLSIGVYGTNADGTLVIPTIWAELGVVRYAADPSGDTSTDPALPVWAQIQAAIGKLEDLGTADKSTLVAAVNEILEKGGNGGVDEAEVERIVEEYLEKNPPAPGNDYVLTEDDKQEIAEMTAELVKVPDSGGNADQVILKSPDGTEWKITVSNSGVITATKVSGGGSGGSEDAPTTLETYTIFVPQNVSDEWKVSSKGALNMSTAEFLELFYDGFVSTPPSGMAVTKQSIGKDESGQYDMWEYDFCPTNYSRTILLSSGMHTYELAASFGLANFIGHLYTDSGNDAFSYIRNNVRVKVIPVVNPWGFNQYPKTYGNVNGVNPNRNFDIDGQWAAFPTYTPSENEWNVKGEAPFSEAEAHNLARWAEENWNAEFWIDCHTGEGYSDKDLWVYYSSDSAILDRINGGISAIEAWFKETYGTDCVTTRTIDSEGSIRLFWAEKVCGIPGMTLEQAPKRTTYGTEATNEAADISNYSTNISTFVQEFLLEKYMGTEEVAIIGAQNPADFMMDETVASTTITATVNPADTTQNHFKWTSSNESVCKVYGGTNKAVVVKVGEGTAVLTAVNQYNPSISVTCNVTISTEEESTEITSMRVAVEGFTSSTGAVSANNARMFSDFVKVVPGSSLDISCANGYYLKAFEYDSNYNYLGSNVVVGDLVGSHISGTLNNSCAYIRLLFKRSDSGLFMGGDIEKTEITVNGNTFNLTAYETETSAQYIILDTAIGVGLDSETGEETENEMRAATDFVAITSDWTSVSIPDGWYFVPRGYDENKNYLGNAPYTNWFQNQRLDFGNRIPTGTKYLRFVLKPDSAGTTVITALPQYIKVADTYYELREAE